MFGQVVKVETNAGYGFIRGNGAPPGPDTFFHAERLTGLEFGPELVGERVDYETVETPRGVRAVNVRPAEFM